MAKKKDKADIQTDPKNGSHDFLESLRGMIQAEVQRAIQDLKPSQVSGGKYPMAPQPKLKGKKFLNSERVKLSVMVDKNLYKQVLTAGRETSRSYSQIVDAALWHYFGKPKLSFEGKDEDGQD